MSNTRKPMTAIETMAILFHVDQKLTKVHYLQAEQEILFNETIDLLCELARNYETTLPPASKAASTKTDTDRQTCDYTGAHGSVPGRS